MFLHSSLQLSNEASSVQVEFAVSTMVLAVCRPYGSRCTCDTNSTYMQSSSEEVEEIQSLSESLLKSEGPFDKHLATHSLYYVVCIHTANATLAEHAI